MLCCKTKHVEQQGSFYHAGIHYEGVSNDEAESGEWQFGTPGPNLFHRSANRISFVHTLGEPILAWQVPAAAVEDTIGININCITERGQRVKCADECVILPEPRSKVALLEDTT